MVQAEPQRRFEILKERVLPYRAPAVRKRGAESALPLPLHVKLPAVLHVATAGVMGRHRAPVLTRSWGDWHLPSCSPCPCSGQEHLLISFPEPRLGSRQGNVGQWGTVLQPFPQDFPGALHGGGRHVQGLGKRWFYHSTSENWIIPALWRNLESVLAAYLGVMFRTLL